MQILYNGAPQKPRMVLIEGLQAFMFLRFIFHVYRFVFLCSQHIFLGTIFSICSNVIEGKYNRKNSPHIRGIFIKYEAK